MKQFRRDPGRTSLHFLAIGAVLVGIGLSVSGYSIKSEASEIPSGAVHNKIELNVGSLLSGIVLLISLNSKNIFFGVAIIIHHLPP